jgi:CRP-like cAMP-binding protein
VVSPDVLQRWQFFGGLDDGALQALADITYESSFEDGQTIFHEGSPATTLYLLCEGWVDIIMGGDGQTEHPELVTTLTRGDIFGWSTLVAPYVYTASARCATPVSVLAFPADKMLVLLRGDGRLCYAVMNRICQVLASRLWVTRQQLVSLYVAH